MLAGPVLIREAGTEASTQGLADLLAQLTPDNMLVHLGDRETPNPKP